MQFVAVIPLGSERSNPLYGIAGENALLLHFLQDFGQRHFPFIYCGYPLEYDANLRSEISSLAPFVRQVVGWITLNDDAVVCVHVRNLSTNHSIT